MAKLRSVIGSGFVGRIGNVVGVRGKGGEYVIRARAEEVKNPNTLRQRTSRMRMSTASKMAAGLASAIQAGFGKAAGNTNMYPRNMFVRDLVKFDENTPLHIEGGEAVLQYDTVKMSKRYGISTIPAAGAADFEEPHQIGVPFTAQPVVDVLPAGKMGIVLLAYAPELNTCAVTMVEAPTTGTASKTLTVPSSWSGETVHVYAFYKWIPETGNDIATDTEPWKYPAETGDTVYIGSGNIG